MKKRFYPLEVGKKNINPKETIYKAKRITLFHKKSLKLSESCVDCQGFGLILQKLEMSAYVLLP